MSRGYRFNGAADSLALLWGAQDRSGRRTRSNLSLDKIVTSAVELADTEGLAALSMRRVAERLGIGTMTLYTYLPGKDELIDLMLDSCYGETVPARTPPGNWRVRLENIAHRGWELYERHPWMLQVPRARPALGPGATAKYEHELSTVAGIGLTEIEMDLVVNLVTGHVEGTARRRLEAAQTEQSTGMTDQQWWEANGPMLRTVADAERFPLAARVGEVTGEAYGGVFAPARAFEFGLHRVLDGVQSFIDSRTQGTPMAGTHPPGKTDV
ncbi:TetR/AcrR family transcriptional regulator [Streptomyces sp. NPDC051172]|uniref:TetR/AcrR family transcriptional regulator n=1 Tax=Streptomyces sp. NPDC051172 TaxID=3155796 RepID=UPI003444059C